MSLFTELLIIISNPHYYNFLRTENMNIVSQFQIYMILNDRKIGLLNDSLVPFITVLLKTRCSFMLLDVSALC